MQWRAWSTPLPDACMKKLPSRTAPTADTLARARRVMRQPTILSVIAGKRRVWRSWLRRVASVLRREGGESALAIYGRAWAAIDETGPDSDDWPPETHPEHPGGNPPAAVASLSNSTSSGLRPSGRSSSRSSDCVNTRLVGELLVDGVDARAPNIGALKMVVLSVMNERSRPNEHCHDSP
jgi:hypothetical protein